MTVKDLIVLDEICFRENSNFSSVINNLFEEFLNSFDSPQTTIDVFQTEKKMPLLSADPLSWRLYYQSLDKTEYDSLDRHFNTVLYLHNLRGREF